MTKETEVQPAPETVKVSAEREEVEIVETVDIDQPDQPEKDYKDVIVDSDDPRAHIYARHSEKRTEEIEGAEALDVDENADITSENPELNIETGESGAIIGATPDTATPPDAVEMVNVKILGDTRSVPKAKVDAQGGIENYQIRIAAQEQMERNAHERAALAARGIALDEQERRMGEKTAAIPAMDSQSSQNPDRSTPLDGQNLQERARRYQEAVYDDAPDAPSILADMVIMAAESGEKFDKNEFRKQVLEDLRKEQRQAKIVTAGQVLVEAHPELNVRSASFDQRMYDNIDIETLVVEREHPTWEPATIVKEAYDRINKWKGVPPQPQTMSDKQAQKRTMTRPRVGTQRYTPPTEPPRATNADYVASERKRRGLD